MSDQGVEERVRSSEDRFRALVTASAQIIWTANAGGEVDTDQPLWREYTGQSIEEMLGQGWLQAIHPDDREHVEQVWASALAQKRLFEIEYRLCRHDGIYHMFFVRGVPVSRQDGSIREWVIACNDITALKELQAQQKKNDANLRALLSLTDSALGNLHLDELLHEMLVRIRTIMSVDNTVILLVDEQKQYLTVRAVLGPEEAVAEQVRVPVGKGFAGYIAAHSKPLIISDLSKAEVITAILKEKLHSLLGVPLLVEGRVIGVLHVGTVEPRNFTEDDVQLLQRVADRVALAIDHASLYEAALKAKTEATQRARQLEAVFSAMVDGVVVYDREGNILDMNNAARELLLVGGQVTDYYTQPANIRMSKYRMRNEQGELLTDQQLPLQRVLRGDVLKGEQAAEVILRKPEGPALSISVSGTAIYNEKKEISGAVLVFRDVTARRMLERRTHEALQALLTMAEALVLHDEAEQQEGASSTLNVVGKRLTELTHRVLECQRVALVDVEPETGLLEPLALEGVEPALEARWASRVRGRHFRDFLSAAGKTSFQGNEVVTFHKEEAVEGVKAGFETYRGASTLLAPMLVGEQLVGLLLVDYGQVEHEYSPEEKALAGAIARLAALVIERERLLRERAEARANEMALREANRRMDEFLGIACHELKTPLAAIKGNIQLAERGVKRSVEGQEKMTKPLLLNLLDNARRQTDRLDHLVNDLLDVSRIQVGQLLMRMTPCNLVTIVREAVHEQSVVLPQRKIYLSGCIEEPIPVEADAERIRQVVSNYLTNALKYSLEDKPVEVSITLEGKMAKVAVKDEGVGLPEHELQRIWERFHRVEEIEVQSGSGVGLGLGLHISKTIISRHQGQVGVESVWGKGSTFWFTLPVQPTPSAM